MGYCAPRSSPTHCHCLRLESRHCRPRKFPRGYLEQCDEQEDKALPSRNVPSLIFRSHTSFLLFYCPLCLAGLPDFQTMHTWSRNICLILCSTQGTREHWASVCRTWGFMETGLPGHPIALAAVIWVSLLSSSFSTSACSPSSAVRKPTLVLHCCFHTASTHSRRW